MKKMSTVKNLSNCQPLFQAFCEDRVLREGDQYSAADYLLWIDNMPLELEAYYFNKREETLADRALLIAAKIMQAAGLCRYEDESMCHCKHIAEPEECDKCIRSWLLSKAAAEAKERIIL